MASSIPSTSPAPATRPVVLVGMMGSGKTTVGRALAQRLGADFVDSDAEVAALTGRTVEEIWDSEGEQGFRHLEAQVLAQALSPDRGGPSVIAAAGGVVLDQRNRELLRGRGRVVWLRADPDTLAARVGEGHGRPLLRGDPAGVLRRLDVERRPFYRQVAELVVDVDQRPVEATVETILEALKIDRALHTVDVKLPGGRAYPVVVGAGAVSQLPDLLPVRASRAAVVTQAHVGVSVDTGHHQETFVMTEGEAAKTLATVETLCRRFADFGLTRADVVVAVGGGVVTDTAGLAAALYHRGVAVVNVATTLLGQVDAAIGGKTGVNLPEGKNLVGAFWQPSAVVCDTDFLVSLPAREYRSGLGEMAKYHFLPGGESLEGMALCEQVARCAAIKAGLVAADEREALGETGGRALLNYGHTLAHALETAGHYDLRHGEAVAVGLVFAARLARQLGRIGDDRVSEHQRVVTGYGLPSALPAGVESDQLLALMRRDKKAVQGPSGPTERVEQRLTFVLDGPNGLEVVTGVREADVEATLAQMAIPA